MCPGCNDHSILALRESQRLACDAVLHHFVGITGTAGGFPEYQAIPDTGTGLRCPIAGI